MHSNVSVLMKRYSSELKRILSDSQKTLLKRLYLRLYCLLYRNNLSNLAVVFGSDKKGGHYYAQHYQHHFESLRHKKLNILEIGVGGYANPRDGGQSLRMWKAYFSKSHIFGIDIYDKTFHDEKRIKTFRGSQIDGNFLNKVAQEIGEIDIIIDDGSHYNDHVIKTFNILFPMLSPKGIYVAEDLQTSYWSEIAGQSWGGSGDLTAPHTSMNFFKSLLDGLNYEEFMSNEYVPSYFDRHIVSMHFYHNLVFIYKGLNNEGSNMLGKRFLLDDTKKTPNKEGLRRCISTPRFINSRPFNETRPLHSR